MDGRGLGFSSNRIRFTDVLSGLCWIVALQNHFVTSIEIKSYFQNFFRNVKCGRLHCTHENEKLAFGDPSTVYTAYTGLHLGTGEEVACRVVWTKYVGGKKEPDPGMVPDGAYCGEDEVTFFFF